MFDQDKRESNSEKWVFSAAHTRTYNIYSIHLAQPTCLPVPAGLLSLLLRYRHCRASASLKQYTQCAIRIAAGGGGNDWIKSINSSKTLAGLLKQRLRTPGHSCARIVMSIYYIYILYVFSPSGLGSVPFLGLGRPAYIFTHTHTYIYICVCVCVCVCLTLPSALGLGLSMNGMYVGWLAGRKLSSPRACFECQVIIIDSLVITNTLGNRVKDFFWTKLVSIALGGF